MDSALLTVVNDYQNTPKRTLSERETLIATLLQTADEFRWRAFLEIYWIYTEKAWQEVVDDAGHPVYDFFEDYIEDLSGSIPALSRRLVFDRIQTIKRYKELGMPDDELCQRSPTALREAAKLLEWDRRGKPKDGTLSVEEFRNFLDETRDHRAVDIKALVDEKRGEQRMMFFGSIEPSNKQGYCLPSIRGVDQDGVTYGLSPTSPWHRDLVDELGRRLGIKWDEIIR